MRFNLKYQIHLETAAKFILLATILFLYFIYLIYKYDLSKGGITLGLTWSFFVLCTPVADAGFLIDFPLRLLFGLRMLVVEAFVWILATTIVGLTLYFAPTHFETTLLTRLFHKIITHPYPYWILIVLCFIGTFASIYFGDEMMDVLGHHERVKHHKHSFKYKGLVLVTITFLVITVYYQLVKEFGIQLY